MSVGPQCFARVHGNLCTVRIFWTGVSIRGGQVLENSRASSGHGIDSTSACIRLAEGGQTGGCGAESGRVAATVAGQCQPTRTEAATFWPLKISAARMTSLKPSASCPT